FLRFPTPRRCVWTRSSAVWSIGWWGFPRFSSVWAGRRSTPWSPRTSTCSPDKSFTSHIENVVPLKENMNPLGVTERVHLESKPAGEPSIPELKRSLAQYWNERSAGFERAQGIAVERQRAAWLAFLDEALGNPPQKILDVGTGTGFLALLAAELGHEVKGLDLSPGMVERAQELAGERG